MYLYILDNMKWKNNFFYEQFQNALVFKQNLLDVSMYKIILTKKKNKNKIYKCIQIFLWKENKYKIGQGG